MELSRRDLMKYGLLGSAALLLPIERVARTKLALNNRMPASKLPKPYELSLYPEKLPVATPSHSINGVDYYNMHMQENWAPILGPGRPATRIFGYGGETPGPTIKVDRHTRVAIRHCNQLPGMHPDPAQNYPVTTSVHLHGSASLPQYDGYASDITKPGDFKDYFYPNYQDPRTLWYHDHGIHHTANNAYMGLAAQYHIIDKEQDEKLQWPIGRYDIPLTVRDAMFDTDGQMIYADNSESGVYGDVILVDGVPWPKMKVEPRKYRFRILNASISRSYKWRLSNGMPFTVVATDGGLMPKPMTVKTIRHSMAERYEVIIDFSKCAGQSVELLNDSPPNNIDYDNTHKVMRFDVGTVVTDTSNNSIPTGDERDASGQPFWNPEVMELKDDPRDPSIVRREFKFERKNGHWTVNGETWENVIDSGYEHVLANPKVGAKEIWTLHNPGGGWFHPVHIHLVDFKILDRVGGVKAPEMDADGVFPYEKGPKDVVYVGEGEKVRVMIQFDDTRARLRDGKVTGTTLPPREGRYMMHCHNLVHEDHDMMIQFQVGGAGQPWGPGVGTSELDKKTSMEFEDADIELKEC